MLPLPIVTALRDPVEEGSGGALPDFRRIFEGYARYVWRVLRRLGVPEADVPDVAQEVFLILRRKLNRVERPVALRSFIYGIAVREASDHRRSAYVRRERVADDLPDESIEATQEDELERARARVLLESALQRLDDDKRAVFVLYELEELGMREVCAAIGCPLQTAYSRLHAARRSVTDTFHRAARGRT